MQRSFQALDNDGVGTPAPESTTPFLIGFSSEKSYSNARGAKGLGSFCDFMMAGFDYYLLDHHADHAHKSIEAKPRDAESGLSTSWLTHLDGLRGIAVLGVLLFHFELLGCVGGYTGVDMFLVLSGFLMTRNILKKLTVKQFSAKEFYIARFWRLYPSSLLTSLLTVIAAYLIFPPDLALDAVKSALASMGLVSNVWFSMEVGGYFDRSVILKPLLHTWSLSLEEQYYFFWPLFLILTFSVSSGSDSLPRFYSRLKDIVTWITALSFALAVHMSIMSPTYAWYLLPTRVYEFTLGSMALLIGNQIPGSKLFHEILAVLCLISVMVSYFAIKDGVYFPGWYSLPSTIGAVLLINLPDTWVARSILSSRVLRFFGKISYAAYLVHWPLWVYYCYVKDSRDDGWLIFGLTVVLAYIQLHAFENPMRISVSTKSAGKKKGLFFLLALFSVGFSVWGFVSDGWNFRSSSVSSVIKEEAVKELLGLPETGAEGNENYEQRIQIMPRSLDEAQTFSRAFLNGDLTNIYPYIEFVGKPIPNVPPKAVVFADSYFGHFDRPLALIAQKENTYFAVNSACGCFLLLGHSQDVIKQYYPPGPRDRCRLQAIAGEEYLKQLKQRTVVVLMFRWSATPFGAYGKPEMLENFYQGIPVILRSILKYGHKALIFGSPPGGPSSPEDCLNLRASILLKPKPCPVWDAPEKHFDVYNNLMVNITSQSEFRNDVRFINLRPLLCKSTSECRQIGSNGRPMYRDGVAHMSVYGSMLLYKTLQEELNAMSRMLS